MKTNVVLFDFSGLTGSVYAVLVPVSVGSKPVSSGQDTLCSMEAKDLMRLVTSWTLERAIKATQTLLAVTLIVSAALAAWVVATDGFLRAVAPSHEYGLLSFAVVDILLSVVVFLAPRVADTGAFAAAIVQVAAMLGDAFTFAPAGTTQAGFRMYLLSDVGFVTLLVTQLALTGITTIGGLLFYESRHKVHAMQPSKLRLS